MISKVNNNLKPNHQIEKIKVFIAHWRYLFSAYLVAGYQIKETVKKDMVMTGNRRPSGAGGGVGMGMTESSCAAARSVAFKMRMSGGT